MRIYITHEKGAEPTPYDAVAVRLPGYTNYEVEADGSEITFFEAVPLKTSVWVLERRYDGEYHFVGVFETDEAAKAYAGLEVFWTWKHALQQWESSYGIIAERIINP